MIAVGLSQHLKYNTSAAAKFRIIVLLAVSTVNLSTVSCSRAINDNWDTYQNSVVRLVVDTLEGTSTGTAFSVSENGYYITNHHVIEKAIDDRVSAIEAVSPASKVHPASVVWSNPEQDLAIVQVPTWINPALPLYSPGNVKINLPVLSLGFPGSSDEFSDMTNPAWIKPTLKRGIISEVLDTTFEKGAQSLGLYEHSAAVNTGNSGGPLFDECGRVVGVNVAKATSTFDVGRAFEEAEVYGVDKASLEIQEGTFFAIRIEEVVSVLSDEAIEFEVTNRPCLGERLSPNQFIAGLVALFVLFVFAVLAIILYSRKRVTRMMRSRKSISEMFISDQNPMSTIAVSDTSLNERKTKVYRGDSGEVVDTDSVRIECVTGNASSFSIYPGQSIKLGRDNVACEICILNEHISREHARVLMLENGRLSVIDLKSSAGTFLDGLKVPDEPPGLEILPGARLLLGSEDVVYVRVVSKD